MLQRASNQEETNLKNSFVLLKVARGGGERKVIHEGLAVDLFVVVIGK